MINQYLNLMINQYLKDNIMTMLPYLFSTFFQPNFAYHNSKKVKTTMTEKEDGFQLQIPLVGRKLEDIEIFTENQKLIVKAPPLTFGTDEDQRFVLNEIGHQTIQFNFNLPKTVNEEAIEAQYTKGVLQIQIPKKQVVQRSIKIQSTS